MKKFLMYLFMSVMLMSTAVCAEETEASAISSKLGVDLNALTSEELLELKIEIIDEINSRDEMVDIIHSGVYVVGTDIKEGFFTITVSKESAGLDLRVYESEEIYDEYWEWVSKPEGDEPTGAFIDDFLVDGMSETIHLQNGMVLYLDTGDGIIESLNDDNKPSWAP